MKRKLGALLCACLAALTLTGCSFRDVMLYLYGGDDFVQGSGEPEYLTYDGDNGITVCYNANDWNTPVMQQQDTISITAGNRLDYTAVLLQVTDTYTDFLEQSGEELNAETNTVRYDFSLTVPDASAEAVRYDCGSYQMIFAEIAYDCGTTLYVSAASRSADYDPIVELLQNIYPTGHTPETAAQAS